MRPSQRKKTVMADDGGIPGVVRDGSPSFVKASTATLADVGREVACYSENDIVKERAAERARTMREVYDALAGLEDLVGEFASMEIFSKLGRIR